MVSDSLRAATVVPRPHGDLVATVTAKTEKALKRSDVAHADPDLFSVAYGMISSTSSVGRWATHTVRLVHAPDWTEYGVVVSRSRPIRGWRIGYLRAPVGPRTYEAFADEASEGITTLLRDGHVLGWWHAVQFSYEGRFAAPLVRELWTADKRRLGILETANLTAGCAALEIDPHGAVVVPLRVKPAGVIAGNPWRELAKLTPFGRSLGPRAASLDTVLTRQAQILAPDEQDLLFAASLSLRAMECLKAPSND